MSGIYVLFGPDQLNPARSDAGDGPFLRHTDRDPSILCDTAMVSSSFGPRVTGEAMHRL